VSDFLYVGLVCCVLIICGRIQGMREQWGKTHQEFALLQGRIKSYDGSSPSSTPVPEFYPLSSWTVLILIISFHFWLRNCWWWQVHGKGLQDPAE